MPTVDSENSDEHEHVPQAAYPQQPVLEGGLPKIQRQLGQVPPDPIAFHVTAPVKAAVVAEPGATTALQATEAATGGATRPGVATHLDLLSPSHLQGPITCSAPSTYPAGTLMSPSSINLLVSPGHTADLLSLLVSPRHTTLSESEDSPHGGPLSLETIAAAAAAELQQRRARCSTPAEQASTGSDHRHPSDPGSPQQVCASNAPAQLTRTSGLASHAPVCTAEAQAEGLGTHAHRSAVQQQEQQASIHEQQSHQPPHQWSLQQTMTKVCETPHTAEVLQQQDAVGSSWHSVADATMQQGAPQSSAPAGEQQAHIKHQQHTSWGGALPPVDSSAAVGFYSGCTAAAAAAGTTVRLGQHHSIKLERLVTGALPKAACDSLTSGSRGAAQQQQQQHTDFHQAGQSTALQLRSVPGPFTSSVTPSAAHSILSASLAPATSEPQVMQRAADTQVVPGAGAAVVQAPPDMDTCVPIAPAAAAAASSVELLQAPQEHQQVFTHTRQLTCKTYLKRLNVTQYMSDNLLPCMEGSLRSSSHRVTGPQPPAMAITGNTGTAAAAAGLPQGGAGVGDPCPDPTGDQHAAPGKSKEGSSSSSKARQRTQPKSYELLFKVQIKLVDPSGRAWPVVYEGVLCAGQRHLRLTCGWSEFIKARSLGIGDSITFERRGDNRGSLAVYAQHAGQESEVPYQGALPTDAELKVIMGNVRAPAAAAARDLGSGDSSCGGLSREPGSRGTSAGSRQRGRTASSHGNTRQQSKSRMKRAREYQSEEDTDDDEEVDLMELDPAYADMLSSHSTGAQATTAENSGSFTSALLAQAARGEQLQGQEQQQQQQQDKMQGHMLPQEASRAAPHPAQLMQMMRQSSRVEGGFLAASDRVGSLEPLPAAAAAAAAAAATNAGEQLDRARVVTGSSSFSAAVWQQQQQQLHRVPFLQQSSTALPSHQLAPATVRSLSFPVQPSTVIQGRTVDVWAAAAIGSGGSADGEDGEGTAVLALPGGGAYSRQPLGSRASAAAAGVRPQRLHEFAAFNRTTGAASNRASDQPSRHLQYQQQYAPMQAQAARSSSAPVGDGLPAGWQVSTGFLGNSPGARFGSASLPATSQPTPGAQISGGNWHSYVAPCNAPSSAAAVAAAIAASNSWTEPRGQAIMALCGGVGRSSSAENNDARGSSGGGGSGGGLSAGHQPSTTPIGRNVFEDRQSAAATAAAGVTQAWGHSTVTRETQALAGLSSTTGIRSHSAEQPVHLWQAARGAPGLRGTLQSPAAPAADGLQQHLQGARATQADTNSHAAAAAMSPQPRLPKEVLQQLEHLLDPDLPWDPTVLTMSTAPPAAATSSACANLCTLPPQHQQQQQQVWAAVQQQGCEAAQDDIYSRLAVEESTAAAAAAAASGLSFAAIRTDVAGSGDPSVMAGWQHNQEVLIRQHHQGMQPQQHQQQQLAQWQHQQNQQQQQQQPEDEAWMGGMLQQFFNSDQQQQQGNDGF